MAIKLVRFSPALLLVLLVTALPLAASSQPLSPAWQAKVDPAVLLPALEGQEPEFLVYLADQPDLDDAASLPTKTQKGAFVYQTLSAHAARTQAPLVRILQSAGATYRSYWITNLIWVRGDSRLLQQLAERPEVSAIYANPRVRLALPEPEPASTTQLQAPTAIEWNLLHIGADQVWALGSTGQGVVIGGQDTGYEWDHPALIEQYRGWDGITADHNYNWHDAIHANAGFNECGADSPEPCDDHRHGTHTMGTMVGDDGGSNQVGMAPGAEWIGCRNMDEGVGTPQTYIECYQWFVAPTDLNDANPDPAKAPHIINNSWSCPISEGCTEPQVLLAAVQNVRAAGILTVHSAGNGGSSCGSVSTPAATYDESYSVGNTTSSDQISFSSSRGPVLVDGSGRLKPDIAAPGTGIRSSVPPTLDFDGIPDGYTSLSGTSMAAPHVAGLGALLISANPDLAGQVNLLESLISRSALPLTSTLEACGDIPAGFSPNNTFGYGRIDALAAYQQASAGDTLLVLDTAVSSPLITAGELLTYTLTVDHALGNTPASSLVLTNTLPAGADFVQASGVYQQTGDQVRWELPGLLPGERWQVTLVVSSPLSGVERLVNYDIVLAADGLAPLRGEPLRTVIEPGPLLMKTFFPSLFSNGTTFTVR
jgi:uncharacterized repeat protein (TIGR01451 family)